MWINANLANLTAAETIISANNRQVLALKKTWQQQKGNSKLPKIFSYQQFLQNTYLQIFTNTSKRLISPIESRVLIGKSMLILGQSADNQLLDEVVKNIDYCHHHLISFEQLSKSHGQNSALFCSWSKHYQQYKIKHNLLDINDLADEIINAKKDISKPLIYGFKTLTPQQLRLFEHIGYQILNAKKPNLISKNLSFKTTDEEILQAAKWAKKIHQTNPQKHIVIVSPILNNSQHQIRSIFDQVFDDVLVETRQKAYNISLGLPLNKYPLIQHILLILQLCIQLNRNKISTETFNSVLASPYISGAKTEIFARAGLANQVLKLAKTHFKLQNISQHLQATPQLKVLLDKALSLPVSNSQSHEKWLLDFNTNLQAWGFAADRTLSSDEYQLFNKYQQTSLGLNKLAQIHKKVSAKNALADLKNWLSEVIFQAQSAKTPIQILGSLEAEGLYFDHAWVLGINADFLPAGLNSPRFIPANIAAEHQIPHSNFELINADAAHTLSNLINLADEVICSYSKSDLQGEKHPSPLLEFDEKISPLASKQQVVELENIADEQGLRLENHQVSGGVNILKDQMACAFKGFVQRLNITNFDTPHIGLNRLQQGEIIHQILEQIYQQISTHAELQNYSENELDNLLKTLTEQALKPYQHSGFITIELARVRQLLHQFLTLEKRREGFEVVETEQVLEANIAGLRFNIRLDRVDDVAGGRIIFDYKTGTLPSNPWCGGAIKEPQLPIYALKTAVDGVAFAQISAQKIGYIGLAKDEDLLPNKTKQQQSCEAWDEQLSLWQQRLEQASLDYQSGRAEVLPTKGACVFCKYSTLCRIEFA